MYLYCVYRYLCIYTMCIHLSKYVYIHMYMQRGVTVVLFR